MIEFKILAENRRSIGIAFIGKFSSDLSIPPPQQFHALQELLNEGVRLGKLTFNYILIPHRCFTSAVSPGNGVVNEIKTWEHYFANNPSYQDICDHHV